MLNHKKSNNSCSTLNRTQRGVGLIEVMVAILLLALGLLGAVALQFATAKEQRSSQFVARAALLGNEIAERMRVNRAGVEAGLYDMSVNPNPVNSSVAFTYTAVRNVIAINTQAQNTCTPLPTCATPAWVAQQDTLRWWQSSAASMPQVAAIVLPVPAMQDARDIVLAWIEPVVEKDANGNPLFLSQPAGNNGCPAVIDARVGVRCYQLRFVL